MPRGICSATGASGNCNSFMWKIVISAISMNCFPIASVPVANQTLISKALAWTSFQRSWWGSCQLPNWASKFTPHSIPEITKHSISLLRMWPRRIVYHLFNAITPLKNWKCAALLDPRRLMGHLYTVPWLMCFFWEHWFCGSRDWMGMQKISKKMSSWPMVFMWLCRVSCCVHGIHPAHVIPVA